MSFILPFLVILTANIAMGVFPFGERAVLIIDSFHQYAPFFSEFYDKIVHGGSLFYTWNGGLGVNFWAIVSYYLSSPLNVLVLLMPRALLTEAFALVIMLKVSLSGLTFSWYISKHYKKYDITIVYFSLFYALGGWTLGYNWNIMWLDCIVLFPVIMLGIERLVREGRGLLYGISLGVCIFCNYYISIMICMFLVLYFFVLFFQRRTRSFRLFIHRGIRFAGYSLMAGGLSAVMVLPAMFALLKTHSADSSFPETVKFYENFWDIIGQHMAFTEPTELTGLPNLYCGVIVLMFVVLFLIRPKTPLRYKLSRVLLIVFFVFSCNVNVLDYIWHGFHFPNSLPERFTFMYIFLLLTMCYEVFLTLHKYGIIQQFTAFIISMASVVAIYTYGEETKEMYVYMITLGFLWVYFLTAAFYKYYREKRNILKYVFCFVFIVEAAANGVFGLLANGTVSRTSYNQDLEAAKQVRALTGDEGRDALCRTEINEFSGRNNAMYLGFKSMSLFSSTLSDGLDELMDHMGFFAAVNKFSYECSTCLTDDILGIRYLMSEKKTDRIRGFEYLQEVDNNYLYINKNALSIGFMVRPSYAKWHTESENPWEVLNDYAKKAAGTEADVFDEEAVGAAPEAFGGQITKQEENKYHFSKDASDDEHKVVFKIPVSCIRERYIYYEAPHMDKLTLEINGNSRSFSDTRGHIADLGQCGPEDEIILTFILDDNYSSADIRLSMFSLDEAVYQDVIRVLSSQQMVVETYSDTSVKGYIEADADGLMFTSVPYDSGWTVYVDGKKTETKALKESLMYIEMPQGYHDIEMVYVPAGFAAGFAITSVSFIITVVFYFRQKRSEIYRKRPETIKKRSETA